MEWLVVLCLVSSALASLQAPIPYLNKEPGFRFDPTSVGAQVKLEAFFDLQCPDSAYSWPILEQLQLYYGPDKLDVVIHQSPLPYHRQAWISTMGLHLVQAQKPKAAEDYMSLLFDNIDHFGAVATRDMSELDVIHMLAEMQENTTGIPAQHFARDTLLGIYKADTVSAWKFGVRRGVAGTPWFWLNGVDLSLNPSIRLSYDDWLQILNPMFLQEVKVPPPPFSEHQSSYLPVPPQPKVPFRNVESNIQTLESMSHNVPMLQRAAVKVEARIHNVPLPEAQTETEVAEAKGESIQGKLEEKKVGKMATSLSNKQVAHVLAQMLRKYGKDPRQRKTHVYKEEW